MNLLHKYDVKYWICYSLCLMNKFHLAKRLNHQEYADENRLVGVLLFQSLQDENYSFGVVFTCPAYLPFLYFPVSQTHCFIVKQNRSGRSGGGALGSNRDVVVLILANKMGERSRSGSAPKNEKKQKLKQKHSNTKSKSKSKSDGGDEDELEKVGRQNLASRQICQALM